MLASRPMLDPDLVREVLRASLANGGRFAELYVEERSSLSTRLDDGKVEELTSGLDRGAGIRVVHGETAAYAYSNRLDRGSLLAVAGAASASVRGNAAGPPTVLGFRRSDPPLSHRAERPAGSVSPEAKVAWLREADAAARGLGPEVRQVVAAYGDSVQRILVATSDGRWVEEERPRIRLVVQVVAARDGIIQTGFWGPAGLAGAEFVDEHSPRETAERAARQAVAMLDGVEAPAGEMPVVMGPGGGGILFHEACGHGLEADLVQKGSSIYQGKLGQTLASPLVTGVDESTVPNAWGSFSFDDEGWPAQRTVLFDKGVLQTYLYDRLRAERDDVPSSGNGRRQSYANLPIPRMTNTSILPGDASPEEVIRDTAGGFYAKALGGGQVNPATGDFVFGVTEGYLIERGEVTQAVRGANLVGNGIAILSAIDAVAGDFERLEGICGKDGQGVPVGNGSPTLRIARMTVGGPGGAGG
jgi:TldD protein